MLNINNFIQISPGVLYYGFIFKIKITLSGTIVTRLVDLTESSYILDTTDLDEIIKIISCDFNIIKPVSRYKMTQSTYNERLIRFVNKMLLSSEGFVLSDSSKKFLSRYEMLGSFRGSLSLSTNEFAKKIIDLSFSR